MNTPNQLGFFDFAHRYDALTAKGDPLEQLAAHIPWAGFRKTLEKSLHRSKRAKGGRPPFDAILMFKVLVLQALYNLSDDQTEYQIRDRLSFMRFLGLDLHQRIPDAAVHDSQVLEEVLQPKTAGADVWADAAYRSEEIEGQLKKRKLRSKIQHKAYRDKTLTATQQQTNQRWSRVRARVEHVFGHQVMAMGGKLIRTIGRVRARAKIGLKNLTYNFQRFLVLRVTVRGQTA